MKNKKLNLANYSKSAALQLLKFNNKFVQILATKSDDYIVEYINSNFMLTENQKEYIFNKLLN